MFNIIRRDPLRDVFSMSRAFDRLLDRSLHEVGMGQGEAFDWLLPLDVIEKEDEFLVKASVAGIDPDKIEITYTDNTLTVKADIDEEKESKEKGRYHLRERRVGSFCRSISMPGLVDADKIEAESENGILTLHLPKKEEIKPKRIEVKAKKGKLIEGKAK